MHRYFAGLASLLLLAAPATAQPHASHTPSAQGTLQRFLQDWDNDPARKTRYIAAFRDLNGDGSAEALVYLVSNRWCRNNSCTTLVLQQDKRNWRIVTQISDSLPPVRVLDDTAHGWHSIGVWVLNENIKPGYEMELRFNGSTYPMNPVEMSAQAVKNSPAGDDVISYAKDALPLY